MLHSEESKQVAKSSELSSIIEYNSPVRLGNGHSSLIVLALTKTITFFICVVMERKFLQWKA
jgi:hypothetical protein